MVRSDSGFTLLELLIVIVILGVLAAIVVPGLTSGPARARDAKRKTVIHQFEKAFEAYYLDNGQYPGVSGGVYYTNQGGSWTIRNLCGGCDASQLVSDFLAQLAPYMSTVPIALAHPGSKAAYIDASGNCVIGTGGAIIQYVRPDNTHYKISTHLEQDCNAVNNDGGTNTCCPILTGSKGRSFEVYERFTAGSENLNPIF